MDRRNLISNAVGGLGIAALAKLAGPQSLGAQAQATTQKPPPLDIDLVRDFVGAAHGNIDKVKTMLTATPQLVNATYDWGGGDFETALGGASHMGRADVAALLLTHGARMDLFCATMMGKIDVVKAAVADNTSIVHVKGPHGISLLRHAQMGKQDAVVALLTAAGAT